MSLRLRTPVGGVAQVIADLGDATVPANASDILEFIEIEAIREAVESEALRSLLTAGDVFAVDDGDNNVPSGSALNYLDTVLTPRTGEYSTPVLPNAAAAGQVPRWDGTNWNPETISELPTPDEAGQILLALDDQSFTKVCPLFNSSNGFIMVNDSGCLVVKG